MNNDKKIETVVKRDGIDSIMFESMKEAPKVADLCVDSEAIVQDAFTSFYSHDPKVEEVANEPQKTLFETFHNLQEFKDLRSATKGDEISSAIGAVEFSPKL